MEYRVDECGYKFNQRDQDESAIRDGRVRDLESGLFDDPIMIEKEI